MDGKDEKLGIIAIKIIRIRKSGEEESFNGKKVMA